METILTYYPFGGNSPTSESSDFVDYFADQPLENSATFRRTDAMARLDYLWVTRIASFQGLEGFVVDPVSAGIIDAQPSDHRLAVVLVQIR